MGGLLSLWDFGSRKSEGQTNVQAASGVGSGWLGALATTALAGLLIPEPTTSIVGAIGLAIAQLITYGAGSSLFGAGSDWIFDNLIEIKHKNY